MRSQIHTYNFFDTNDNPEGGQCYGNGFCIAWQKGPLGQGDGRKEPNGAFVEDVIAAVLNRLEFYQSSRFACAENAIAIDYLQKALGTLEFRTNRRIDNNTEGTHQGS